MRELNEDNITQAVIARHAKASDARLREVMTSLDFDFVFNRV